jgi:recombination protein RecA
MAIEDKIVDKSGSWINYGEMRLGQGMENAKKYLRENAAVMEEITRKVLEKRGLFSLTLPPAAAEEEKEETPAPTNNRKRAAASAE